MRGRRKAPGPAARLRAWAKTVPHLFAKGTVLCCVAFASGASIWSLRILSRTGHDPASLLAIILGFFGGELLLLCLKTILKKGDNAP